MFTACLANTLKAYQKDYLLLKKGKAMSHSPKQKDVQREIKISKAQERFLKHESVYINYKNIDYKTILQTTLTQSTF